MEDENVISTRLRVSRNLAEEKFFLEAPDLEALKEQLDSRTGPWSAWNFLRPREAAPQTRQLLMEKGLLEPDFIFRPGGWTALAPDGRRCLNLGDEDHFRYTALAPGLALQPLHEESRPFLQALEAAFPSAFDREIGYLRADPRQCGTAAKPSLLFHLPACDQSGLIAEVLKHCEARGYSIRGLWEGEEEGPSLYQMAPYHSTGSSETGSLLQLEHMARKVQGWEAKARDILFQRRKVRIRDLCGRSWGILRNAGLLGLSEALTLVSRLRLGVIMGIIEGVPLEAVTGLFFGMQTGALRAAFPGSDGEEEDELRARWVKSRLDF